MRYIQLTDELQQQAIEEFRQKLLTERFSKNKINFTFDLGAEKIDNKVIVNFTPEVWLKMWSLVHSESGEIGWHGTVTRHNEHMYTVTDILVYPQTVSGVTVQTDDVGYGNWLHMEISDEQINSLRFHGHSHVNMSTSPSGVDTTWYNEILQGLEPNDFYIFTILNKKEDQFIEIYDLATNRIYETKDIIINVILSDNNYLSSWVELTKKKALQPKVVGFQTDRLGAVRSLSDVKPFDAEDSDEKAAFEELLLELSKTDLEDVALTDNIVMELDKRAVWNKYIGLGYRDWSKLINTEKITIAQAYYKEKNKVEKKEFDYWEDFYGKYY